MSQTLGELLVLQGLLTQAQFREAQALQRGGTLKLEEAVLRLGFVDEASLYRVIAKSQGLPFVDLSTGKKILQALIERIPAEFAREQQVLPVAERAGKLIIAIDDPLKRIVVDQLAFQVGCEVGSAIAAPGALRAAIATYYGEAAEADVARSMAGGSGAADRAGDEEGDAPIVRLVTRMFNDATTMRASDIHVEPSNTRVRVRFRIDGILRDIADHPPHLAAPLISRLKIMASMDIAEKRKPQDGRIELDLKGRPIDVRCSILPASHGEAIVMRLLDRSSSLVSLKQLGFEGEDYAWFKRLISRPNGIILVTGPTGSGKTTTLYAALGELNRPDVKIITAEDPVEYHITGLNQVQVQSKIGLSFARVLKAMLRAAPNIILVGEIRDLETAEIAVQASLTGHLVFSTLHTNDAPSALTRLIDMGVKPFLVSAAIQGIMAQRLVRKLCAECAATRRISSAEMRALGLDERVHSEALVGVAKGCRACEGTGYRGRLGLFEVLELDENLREMTFRNASLDKLRATALATGRLRPLIADGARKVLERRTTVTEILRVARSAEQVDQGARGATA
ncbi:MAG: Flp pilus assembly complex ATPase component TadA [Planctomycetes bacterium]|nr:Flp pilus assembly complex ATPase component TadA [Planctomycetota bacterium]